MIDFQAVIISTLVLWASLHTCHADKMQLRPVHNETQAIGAKQTVVRFLVPSLKFDNELTSLLDVLGYTQDIRAAQYNPEVAKAGLMLASVQPPLDKFVYLKQITKAAFKYDQEWNVLTLSTLAGNIVEFNKKNPNCKVTLMRTLELFFETLPLAKKLDELIVQSSKAPSSDSAKLFKELQSEQLLSWWIRNENVMENLQFDKDIEQISNMWKFEVLNKYIEINNKITPITLNSLFVGIYGTAKHMEMLAKWRQRKEMITTIAANIQDKLVGPPRKKMKFGNSYYHMPRSLNFNNKLPSIMDVLGYNHEHGATQYNLEAVKALVSVHPPEDVFNTYFKNPLAISVGESWRFTRLNALANTIIRFNAANSNYKLTLMRTLELLIDKFSLAYKLEEITLNGRSQDGGKFFIEVQLEQLLSWMIREENIAENLRFHMKVGQISEMWKFKVLKKYTEMYNKINQKPITSSSVLVDHYGTEVLLKLLVNMQQKTSIILAKIATQIQNELFKDWYTNGLQPMTSFAGLSLKKMVLILTTTDSTLATLKYSVKEDLGANKPLSWVEILGSLYGWVNVIKELLNRKDWEPAALLLDQEVTRWKSANWDEKTFVSQLRSWDYNDPQGLKNLLLNYEKQRKENR